MFRSMFKRRPFQVVAVLAVRNEQYYIDRCLRHLSGQGIHACVIDNDSSDRTMEIVAAHKETTVIRCLQYPYPGYYDWEGLLKMKQQVAMEMEADWFVHLDADEIPVSPRHGELLVDAFRDVDRRGYDAVNFDEFVFIPEGTDEHWEGKDYVDGIKSYYFFEPSPIRAVRAWKNHGQCVDVASSGGHNVMFPGRKLNPESFVMRHYIALSRQYLADKYARRVFPAHELERGWHYNRVGLDAGHILRAMIPGLKTCMEDGNWDKSFPCREHFFKKESEFPGSAS